MWPDTVCCKIYLQCFSNLDQINEVKSYIKSKDNFVAFFVWFNSVILNDFHANWLGKSLHIKIS